MKTSKHFLLAAALVLLVGLSAGSFAQRKTGNQVLPPEPIDPSTFVNAIEITDGTLGYDGQTKEELAFGYAFLGQTSGAFPGTFTLSMNCTPAEPIPSGTSELKSGAWTLPVYLTGVKGGAAYVGSLYGTITKGTMNWDKTGTNSTVYFVLSVDGGTQAWDGTTGYAIFSGNMFDDEKGQTKLTGELVFTLRTMN